MKGSSKDYGVGMDVWDLETCGVTQLTRLSFRISETVYHVSIATLFTIVTNNQGSLALLQCQIREIGSDNLEEYF